MCNLFQCNAFVYNIREISISDGVWCGGFIFTIKIQQLLFYIFSFKNINKIITWKVYILRPVKTGGGIFLKVDLLPTDNDSEKQKVARKA